MYRYKARKRKGKNIAISLLIVILLVVGIYFYDIYINVNIEKGYNQDNSASRTAQTIEQVNNETREVSDILEEVSKSVVGISKIKNLGSSILSDETTQQFQLGSGTVISKEGYILTNTHVSGEQYSNCYVTLENGKTHTATVIWADKDIDLSIIKVNTKLLNNINLGDSDNIKLGQRVFAIGNPIGMEFQRTVTQGIISAKNRTIKITENETSVYMEDLIQTDATINPGNSGGPLINANGQLIGINSVKITSAEGIGFAVPINLVKTVIEKVITQGKFTEASLGIFAYDKEVIPYLDSNINFENGIYVVQIKTDGPAIKSDLQIGDIIQKIDGIELNKMSDLRKYIYTKEPNDEVSLEIKRKNRDLQVNIKLGRK